MGTKIGAKGPLLYLQKYLYFNPHTIEVADGRITKWNKLMRDVIIIEPGRRERHYWLDRWQYRELFRVLAWRDLSVRYKQTVIGVSWALIRPVLTMLVFTIIFGRIAQLPTDGTAPYALMVFAGMLPWTFFPMG
jgi:lipopolysaccharide transport system permease protein